ncbi:VCBS repeat-containing protein [Streptomyces sp. CC208A]|uniref:FG-GAP repeat domain-containing protein n=1 Tax=Streptomyces sp. CC208A TaxID=3044573 RepID=UPI0024A8ABD9|nr:VCBS repeat-containing protein [Streptomyces sp. CC208A]
MAACTALVLSAGMLLATPASADVPVPRPPAEKPASSEVLPTQPLVPRAEGRAGAAAATAVDPSLSDVDGDGYEDTLFRAMDGKAHVVGTAGYSGQFALGYHEDIPKDIIPIGQQNGSGGPEVLVLSENGTMTLFQDAEATGSYEYSRVGTGWQIYNKVISPGDVNGDGRADVLARTHGGELYLYLGTGHMTGPLSTRKRIGGGWGVYDQVVGVGDSTGDGRADVYARDFSGRLWFYAGTGDLSRPFATRRYIGGGWGVYNQLMPAGGGTLAARDNAGTVYLYRPLGGGVLSPRAKVSDTGGWRGVAQFANSGSVPYTGKGGVIARSHGGTLYWYGNTTRGFLGARQQLDEPGDWDGINLTHISSLNPDGVSDFAVVHEGGLYTTGGFIGWGWGVYNSLVGPGDLSGDGKGDLLARDRDGVLWLYRGNGYGTAFASRVKVGGGWGTYNKLLGAGDYTGDGRTDLLARSKAGDLYLYAGTGQASSPFKGRVKIGGGWGVYKHLVAPGDLNADGKADLLAATSDGTLYRYTNTMPGKFSARTKLGTGFQVYNLMS